MMQGPQRRGSYNGLRKDNEVAEGMEGRRPNVAGEAVHTDAEEGDVERVE